MGGLPTTPEESRLFREAIARPAAKIFLGAYASCVFCQASSRATPGKVFPQTIRISADSKSVFMVETRMESRSFLVGQIPPVSERTNLSEIFD
jgi:hypothetical protein